MGQGDNKLAAPLEALIEQSFRDADAAASRAQAELINLCCEFRKLGMVVGRADYVRQLGSGREQPFQRSINQKVQSIKETFEVIQKTLDSDWNPISAGGWGFMGASGNPRLRAKVRELINEVQGPIHAAGSNEPTHTGGVQLETETGGSGSDPAKNFRHMLQPPRE